MGLGAGDIASLHNNANIFDSIVKFDKTDNKKADGSIFKDSKLQKEYQRAIKRADKSQNPDQAKSDFIQKLYKKDIADDKALNGSVFKDNDPKSSEKKDSKVDILSTLISYDKADNGEVDGSVFNNPALLEYIDKLDDGEANGSIYEFMKFLSENGSNSQDVYNIFIPQSLADSSARQADPVTPVLAPIIKDSQVVYNKNEFTGEKANKKDYQHTVRPAAVTGDGTPQKAVRLALEEIGNKESDGSYLKYGQNGPWCAAFTSHIYKNATNDKDMFKGYNVHSVDGLCEWGKKKGRYVSLKEGNRSENIQKMNPGDIIIFKSNKVSHTGIVTRVDKGGTIHTIEGNTSDKVAERTYKANNSNIAGFIDMQGIDKKR